MQNSAEMPKDQALKWHIQKLAELTGVLPREERMREAEELAPNPLAHLDFLQTLIGKSEIDDYEELVALFRTHGIEPGDIRKDSEAWCGKGIRLALVAAGHEDPGERYNRACNWADFGREAEDPTEPGIVVVYYSHVSCRTEDGGEIGCNVGNSVKVMPAGQNWFGNPIAYRKIA